MSHEVVFRIPYRRDYQSAKVMLNNLYQQLDQWSLRPLYSASLQNIHIGDYLDGMRVALWFRDAQVATLVKLSIAL